ncbi:MAG: hypothetical protein QM772_10235 [Ottowia sp.]|uniref:hypothetical protein n=1 Tax=Ottowia sp. TaxID=1898956 RepID=UPI0039E38682
MRITRLILAGAALLAALGLAACAGTPTSSDAASAKPGVTVYGTVDAGVGRTSR